jgi:hypothetical protein
MLSGLVFVGVILILQLYQLLGRLGDIHSEIRNVKEELQWIKQSSFAHNLREWCEEISKDIAEKIDESAENISRDVIREIQQAVSDIGTALSTIEYNTSHQD